MMARLSVSRRLFNSERDIPYRIPLSADETDDCCSGKHERLLRKFRDAGVEARQRICWFRWSDVPLPQDVAAVPHDDDCTHLYLEVKTNDVWNIVDATWDPGLASVFQVNEWTDGTDMAVAVPATKTLSPEESETYMRSLTSADTEKDLAKHREFYRAFNAWLERIRVRVG